MMPSDPEFVAKYYLDKKDKADDYACLEGAAKKPLKIWLNLYANIFHYFSFPFSSRIDLSSEISFLDSFESSRKAAIIGLVAPL